VIRARTGCRAAWVALALGAATPQARAQRIFGAVIMADSSPARSAIVQAADSTGAVVGRELTTARGDFVLPLPHPGRYTVTALRVGSVAEVVRDVAVQGDTRLRIRFTREAPRPPVTDMRSGERCEIRRDSTLVGLAWAQFQVALATAEMAADTKAFVGTWRRTERTLGRTLKDTVARSDTSEVYPLEIPIIPSIAPDSMREFGFVIESEHGVTYHVPDLATLRSEAFTRARCFAFDPAPPSQPGWAGLHFRSREFRVGVAEIEGTIWLDRATLEPRGLGYRYTNLPPAFDPAEAGGTLRFRQLPTGHWIVEEYTLRVPTGAFRRIFSYDTRGRVNGYATKLTLEGVRTATLLLTTLELNGAPILRRQ
jgi:hypothetical protein